MAINYSKSLPRDQGNIPMQEYPSPIKAIARNVSENAVASSVVTLNDGTTKIEIAAVGQAVAMRWVPSTDTQASVVAVAGATANFDHIIPSGQVRQFVVPQERAGVSSICGANVMNGLFARLAFKSSGIGSVLATEY